MSTNAIFVVAQRGGFSAQVEIKIGIRRDEKKLIRANKFVQWKSALTLINAIKISVHLLTIVIVHIITPRILQVCLPLSVIKLHYFSMIS